MINKFFSVSREILLNKFELSSLAEHSTVLGNAREIFVREFLEKILPTDIEYRTGQITNLERNLSNQCDIILQKKSSPRLGLADSNQISFYEYVLSILEIKSFLDKKAIEEAREHIENILKLGIENKEAVRNPITMDLTRKIQIGGKTYAVGGIPYFIIAYDGIKMNTLEKNLELYNLSMSNLSIPKFTGKDFSKDKLAKKLPISQTKTKIQIIINLKRKYAFIDKTYLDTLDIYNLLNKVKIANNTYVVIEDDDILKFLFFMLNHIFLTPDYNRDMLLNAYIQSCVFYNTKDKKQ